MWGKKKQYLNDPKCTEVVYTWEMDRFLNPKRKYGDLLWDISLLDISLETNTIQYVKLH